MRIPELKLRRLLVTAATLPLVAGTLVLVTPGVAEAATCGQSWSNKDDNWGTGVDYPTGPYTISMHTGIYSACPITWNISTDVRLWYHCYRSNSYGNTWTNVRIDNSNIDGWVSDARLDNGGSIYPC